MEPCKQENTIRQMELALAVAKSDIKNVKEDIKELKYDMKDIKMNVRSIKDKVTTRFDHQTWWIIGVLVTMLGSMSYIIYSNLKG